MTRNETWSPFVGSSSILLTLVLVVIAGGLVFWGVRLKRPITFQGPGKFVGFVLVVLLLVLITDFIVSIGAYVLALEQQRVHFVTPNNPITPYTLASAVVSFLVILTLAKKSGPRIAVGSAIVGTMAAPMIFELPYDLIAMGRTFPPDPGPLYTLMFFLPLFGIEFTCFALLTLSPLTRISRLTLLLLASMFLVFAIWAASAGFGYPDAPWPLACNVISKILAFVIAVSLFVPERRWSVGGDGVVLS